MAQTTVQILPKLDRDLARKIKNAFAKKNASYEIVFDYEKNYITVYYDSSKIKRASDEIRLVLFKLNIQYRHEKNLTNIISDSDSEKLPLITNEETNLKHTKIVHLIVSGMHCSSCQNKIESQLLKMPGVVSATVQLITGEAVVNFDCDVIKDPKEIVKCIKNMGYKVNLDKASVDNNADDLFVRVYCENYETGNFTQNFHFSPSTFSKEIVTKFDSVYEAAAVNNEQNLIRIKFDKNETTKKNLFKDIKNCFGDSLTVEAEQMTLDSTHINNVREHINKWRRQTILTSIFGVPSMAIMIYQMVCPNESYMVVSGLSVSNLVLFIISTLAQVFCAYNYYIPCVRGICSRPGMDTLIALASFVAYFYSLLAQISVIAINQLIKKHKLDMSFLEPPHTFFETPQMLMMFISIGKMLESMAKLRTMDSINILNKMQPTSVDLIVETKDKKTVTETLNVSLVEKDDVISVLPYGVIPLDGTIQNTNMNEANFYEIDESLLTGESAVRQKQANDAVYAGSKNMSSKILYIKVSHSVNDSVIGQLAKLVSQALVNRAPIQKLADVIGGYFVLVIIVLSVFTCGCWLLVAAFSNVEIDPHHHHKNATSNFAQFWFESLDLAEDSDKNRVLNRVLRFLPFAVKSAINVLCVACPCALGLATPTAVMVACGTGALNKILFKGGDVIQKCSRLVFVCFDKTGTLTKGNFCVTKHVDCFENKLIDKFVVFVVGLAENSVARSHPIGRALTQYSINYFDAEKDVQKYILSSTADFATLKKGLGVEVTLSYCKIVNLLKIIFTEGEQNQVKNYFEEQFSLKKGKKLTILLGNEKFVYNNSENSTNTTSTTKVCIKLSTNTTTQHSELFELSDEVRPEAKFTIENLQNSKINVAMITGDCEAPARHVAALTDIRTVHFSCLPHEKADIIKKYMKLYANHVGMVGDGINDSVAMVTASVGISLASGSDLANATADVVLNSNSLTDLLNAIDLAKQTMHIVRRNIFLSVIYNLVAVPIAAGCLEPLGVNVQPWMASIAMSISSLSVVLSSLTLKKYKKKF